MGDSHAQQMDQCIYHVMLHPILKQDAKHPAVLKAITHLRLLDINLQISFMSVSREEQAHILRNMAVDFHPNSNNPIIFGPLFPLHQQSVHQ